MMETRPKAALHDAQGMLTWSGALLATISVIHVIDVAAEFFAARASLIQVLFGDGSWAIYSVLSSIQYTAIALFAISTIRIVRTTSIDSGGLSFGFPIKIQSRGFYRLGLVTWGTTYFLALLWLLVQWSESRIEGWRALAAVIFMPILLSFLAWLLVAFQGWIFEGFHSDIKEGKLESGLVEKAQIQE